jgi:hypothetical protein
VTWKRNSKCDMLNRFIKPWFWRSTHGLTSTTHDFDVQRTIWHQQRMTLTFNAWFWRSTHDFDVQRMILTFNAWFWRSTHDFDVQHMILTFCTGPDVDNARFWRSMHDFHVQRMILTFNAWFWRSTHDSMLTTHDPTSTTQGKTESILEIWITVKVFRLD